MTHMIVFYQDFNLPTSFLFILQVNFQQLEQLHFMYNFEQALLKLLIELKEPMNLC